MAKVTTPLQTGRSFAKTTQRKRSEDEDDADDEFERECSECSECLESEEESEEEFWAGDMTVDDLEVRTHENFGMQANPAPAKADTKDSETEAKVSELAINRAEADAVYSCRKPNASRCSTRPPITAIKT